MSGTVEEVTMVAMVQQLSRLREDNGRLTGSLTRLAGFVECWRLTSEPDRAMMRREVIRARAALAPAAEKTE